MPGLHDRISNNMTKTINENLEEHKAPSSKARASSTSDMPQRSASDYSSRSSVARAYRAGEIPFDHARLLKGLKKALGDQEEGEIILQTVLDSLGMTRKSALNMFGHMQAFGVLNHYEPRHHCVFISISHEWYTRA